VTRAADDALTRVLRREGGRLTAVLARQVGDLQLAEDALQDAGVAAVEVWARTGVPRDPASWLYVAARRKAIDLLRREDRRDMKERDAVALAGQLTRELPEPSAVEDDLLRLVFTCCHPALDLDTRVALALRTLCGLSTLEVARVLLVAEATMAKRLTRAKTKIARAAIPFRVPDAEDLPGRTAAVCAVVHLVYTAGHTAASGDDLLRDDLCDEAIRLARLLVHLLDDQDTPEGLLALLVLTDARRPTRTDAHGELVTLADQDRSRWDAAAIAEGIGLLDRSLQRTDGQADVYQLQAAIAACHATATTYEDTDWVEILRLYEILIELHPNPAVQVNAAVARAEVDGPAAALADLEAVPADTRGHAWHTVRADLLHRIDDQKGAVAALDQAVTAAPTGAERRHLERRRAEILSERSATAGRTPSVGP
jgi:RNA polymerase sigma-70 factor (ECF subfamily)